MAGGGVGNDGGNLVFFYQHISKVGLHFEHVVFVGHDHAVKFLAIFEANFVRLRRLGAEGNRQDGAAQENQAAWSGHVSEYDADRKVVATSARKMCPRRYIPGGADRARGLGNTPKIPTVYVPRSLR